MEWWEAGTGGCLFSRAHFGEISEKAGLQASPRFEGKEGDSCQNCLVLHAYQAAASSPTGQCFLSPSSRGVVSFSEWAVPPRE